MPNPQTAEQTGLKVPNNKNQYEVSQDDLPVHCPMPGSSLWDSHPKVFIAFDKNGKGKCPYCGCEYTLIG
ncbi:MAG: zinc-finger domain-containing protein [Gammaproteobacteria bacterium]|nr:zinc-finger domain-containing protein [Gammaproteobacteria bacterium]